MASVHHGTVGIVPAGALGVAYYFHLTHELRAVDERVFFLARTGSASGNALRERGRLRIATAETVREVAHPALFAPDLLSCAAAGFLPEALLVCTQPDQLLGGIVQVVRLIERLHETSTLDDLARQLPVFILCSNGIYFQRVRQFFIEKLEESTLLGRLPDLWPDIMPQLVARLLRGVTIQTGQREGSGADAVYRPGARGITRLVGGGAAQRERAVALLTERGGWFEQAAHVSPTRVEFDKALINLAVNLLGQLHAIDDAGTFRPLKVAEILAEESTAETRELVQRVFEVGRAVRAYSESDDFDSIHAEFTAAALAVREHVPSSLQWIEQQLRNHTLTPRLTPTEAWLLEPLIRYAHAAGLEDAARYFEDLTRRVEQRIRLAIAAAHRSTSQR